MKRYALPALGLFIVLLVMNLLRVPGAMPTLLFFFMNGIVLATAFRITRRYYAYLGRRTLIPAVFLFYIAEIVLVETVLGMLGILNLAAVIITTSALLIVAISLTRGPAPKAFPVAEWRFPGLNLLTIFLWIAALIFLAAMAAQALVTPPHGWDSYTYHIHFPISWMKGVGISIIPTPFGDPSVAYSPCNGELFFLWLILPFREDFLANLGQLPFLLIGALGLYGIARRMGIYRDASSWSCLIFIFTPAVVAQAAHAYVDIMFAALFILSLEFLILYRRDGKRSTLFLLAISLGLFYGTKSLALSYGLLILVPLAIVFLRRRQRIIRKAAILAAGLCALGGFWYIRNLLVTGNPLYPLTVEVFSGTLFPGMFDRETLLRGYPHIKSLAAAAAAVRMILGIPLACLVLCSIPPCAVALIMKKRAARASLYILALPFLAVIIFGLLTPAHTPERFLLISVPFFALYPAYAATINRPLKWILACAVTICLVLTVRQNPYLTGMVKFVCVTALGLGEGGIPPARRAIACALASAILFPACFLSPPRGLWRTACALCALIAAALSLAAASVYFSADSYKYAYRPSSPHTSVAGFGLDDSFKYMPNPNMLEHAWLWLDRETRGGNIAWAGLNIPGALYGTGLKNNITYVSITPHPDWKEHDYDREFRGRKGYRPPGTLKPAYYRREADYPAWLDNLRKKDIDYLFVTNLSPQERRYLRRNREGFPMEDIWARRHPDVFALIYSSPPNRNPADETRVRIYRVGPAAP